MLCFLRVAIFGSTVQRRAARVAPCLINGFYRCDRARLPINARSALNRLLRMKRSAGDARRLSANMSSMSTASLQCEGMLGSHFKFKVLNT